MLNTHNTGIDLSPGASSGSSEVKVKGELTKSSYGTKCVKFYSRWV